MAELRISATQMSNMTDRVESVTVPSVQIDSPLQQEETTYTNSKASQYLAYYKKIPEVKTAIDTRALWVIGAGIKAEPDVMAIIDSIYGMGNDTIHSILKNMIIQKRVYGDAFAEICRDDADNIVNIKPLDPARIRIVVDKKGILKRYEQLDAGKNGQVLKFKPNEILCLHNKRVCDEIHGTSDIEAMEDIILANTESFTDYKKVMHRYVKPMMKFSLDTDDESKINSLVAKFDAAVNKGENLYIPKGTVEQELISVPANATLSPLAWREHLKSYFWQVCGIPQIIIGGASEYSESSAKIAYLSFEQSIDDEQNDIEAQFWNKLGMRITLTFPTSLKNEALSDEAKDGADSGMGMQPSDITAGVGR